MNNQKEKNMIVAAETLDIIERKCYLNNNEVEVSLEKEIDYCVNNSTYYDNKSFSFSHEIEDNPKFEVVNETTAQAAQRLLGQGLTNLVALNFASAKHPGGGWLRGAVAQEEDLARCSALYPTLLKHPQFYSLNKKCGTNLYTNDIIYSPNVPFFRDFSLAKLDKPFLLSIITSPAPNAGEIKNYEKKNLPLTLRTRALKVLHVAALKGHRNLILGAWGCGIFANDPKEVANAFLYALKRLPAFNNVCFAVYDNRMEQRLYKTFKDIIPA